MAQKFNNGPGVYTSESDLSTVVAPVSTSIGAFVGRASTGPVNTRVFLTRNQDLINTFGNPNASTLGYGLWGALTFLNESSQTWFVRASSGLELYANTGILTSGGSTAQTVSATSTTVTLATTSYEDGNKPNQILELETFGFSTQIFGVFAASPGINGNNLAISVITSANAVSAGFDWQYRYDDTGDASPIYGQVFKINVFLKDSKSSTFNSVSGTPVETFYVSRKQLQDANKNNLFIEKVINGISKYIYVKSNTGVAETTLPSPTGIVALTGGADGASVGASDISSGWTLFSDKENVLVNIMCCTEPGDVNSGNAAVQTVVGNIAASRKDCIALSQIDGTSATVSNVTTIITNANYNYNLPSYVANYAGWELIQDVYNDRQIYLPNVIFGASLMARNDVIGEVWTAPAGPNRGQIGALGLATVWNGTQIGQLRDANINSVKKIQGSGQFMWSQKTAQRKASALSDINVRRLLLYVENSIASSLNSFLYESNNESTRSRVRAIINSFLGTVAAGGGFNTDSDAGFFVQCDSVNNPPSVVDANQLNVNLYVKPIRVIEFIQLNVIILNGSISFTEITTG